MARVQLFDIWQPGYGLAAVRILRAGTDVLADVFTDEALTNAAANPQTLLEKTENGISYGKFSVPLYTAQAYSLQIDSIDQTGIFRPSLTTLSGQDGSDLLVTATGGSEAVSLADHLARRIDVRDFGQFLPVSDPGASAATNTTTLLAAIGSAGSAGGGLVDLPEGVFQHNPLTIPAGVVVQGQAKLATILQCTTADVVWTLGGRGAGFARLTLDGISLVGNSIGVSCVNQDETFLDDVTIKRFETLLYVKGGERSQWRNFTLSNGVDGALLHGDLDAGASATGAAFRNNAWRGGLVELCSGKGVEIKNVDAACTANIFHDIQFRSNTGTAVAIDGARQWTFSGCSWEDNTVNLDVRDGDPETRDNTVIAGEISDGFITDGDIDLEGNLETIVFDRMKFTDVDVTITTPRHNILVRDSRESGVDLAGAPTAWIRQKSNDVGAASGLTTADAATKAWAITLKPGQRVYLEAKVVGRQRNGVNDAFYHIAVSARRPGATLLYDSQTANFTVGNVLTGATSGATARITADTDGGATGTLTLQDVAGDFIDNEIVTDGAGGSATANGTQSTSAAALVGTVAAIRAAQETDTDWEATFVANGPEIELRVTGKAAQTIEWYAHVTVFGA